jgi:hypothetical protein
MARSELATPTAPEGPADPLRPETFLLVGAPVSHPTSVCSPRPGDRDASTHARRGGQGWRQARSS